MTLAGAQLMGTPVECYLSEYMRAVVYRIPGRTVADDKFFSFTIRDAPDFRASVVSDPVRYFSAQDFSEQYTLDANFPDALRNAYDKEAESFEDHVYVVMQWKESMDSFPATQGQCIRNEHDGIEQFFIVDCDDAHMPSPDQQTRNANTILTAIKIEFGITEGMVKIIDRQCYKTDDDKCIRPVHFEGHGRLSVLRPLSLAEVAAKAAASEATSRMLDNGFDSEYTSGKSKGNFGLRLESLIEALQLDPSLDEAYLRLWFLRLYDRADRFGKTCKWQLPNKLPEVKDHRNDVAHRGVEKLDKRLLASFQKSLFGIIRDRISKVEKSNETK